MSPGDIAGLTAESLRAHRMRYGLSALAIGVGVAAVVLISSIGQGTRRFIEAQVSQFGTTLIGVHPGKIDTQGVPGAMGGSQRKLTIADARAIARVPGVAAAMPVAYGTARVERGRLGRNVYVYGVTSDMPAVWSWKVALGTGVPPMDWDRASPVAVLGPRLQRELFGGETPLGRTVRIGDQRFRVVGVMEGKGQFLGFDLDDAAYVPVASAMQLFNLTELSEVDLLASSTENVDAVAWRAERLMKERHDGQEDVTVITQAEGMETMNRVLDIVQGVVTAIAAISLLVGAVGILTIMWIVVQERTAEIGLLKALGARRSQILSWFLTEAALTSTLGGAAGLTVALLAAAVLVRVVPGLESDTDPGIILAAIVMALGVGLVAGIVPALRAARLDPVVALRGE